MAKDKIKKSTPAKTTKASPTAAKPKRAAPAKAAASARTAKPAKVSRPAKAAKTAKISKLAKSPAAAAAALRNPKKAQALALEAADDIKKAAKSGIDSGEAMWKLALDVARRSIDALGDTNGKGKKAKKGKK